MSISDTNNLVHATKSSFELLNMSLEKEQILNQKLAEIGENVTLSPTSDIRTSTQVMPSSPTDVISFADVVSGQFDVDEKGVEPVPTKRVLTAQAETPKLHRVLAQAGIGSRLEMEQLILEGRITVNHEPAHIGQRIQSGDHVKVNGKPIRFRIDAPPTRVIAYHKPAGEIVTHDDPQNRPTVFRKLPRLIHGKWQSVGRLDLNTEGLLLLTSSGELANKLMHPRFGLEREYAVRVLGALNADEKLRLLDGIRIDGGIAKFGSLEEGGGEGANCWYRVTISEGRNREVRRMFEAVGHAVSRLIRIRYGAMVLPRGLKRGAWVELGESDIKSLMLAAKARPFAASGDAAEIARSSGERTERFDPANGIRNRRRGGRGKASLGNSKSERNGPTIDNKSMGQNLQFGTAPGRKDHKRVGERSNTSSQPDPMQTAFGYIGANSFTNQRQNQRSGRTNSKPGKRLDERDR